MSKIRILLYKSKFGDKKWIDNLISLWTWSKYSHVEIWTQNLTNELNSDEYKWYSGTCWTSTMRGKDNGTVKRPASGILDHPRRWDYIEIEIEDIEYANLTCWMDFEVGNNKGYATRDLWKFVIGGLHKPDNSRNICSEFCNNALYVIGKVAPHGIVSPGKLFKKLIKKGYKVKSLQGETHEH